MPTYRVSFALKDDDWQRYQELVARYPSKVKKAVNEYMHNSAKKRMIATITGNMPRSDRIKTSTRGHAKDSVWHIAFDFEQAVAIENKLEGTRKTSFYYLFYPHEGTLKQDSNPFMQKAIDKEYDRVTNDLFNAIEKEINF